jgi:hypothetical protein
MGKSRQTEEGHYEERIGIAETYFGHGYRLQTWQIQRKQGLLGA